MNAEKLNKKLRKTVNKYNRLVKECGGMPGTELEAHLNVLTSKIEYLKSELASIEDPLDDAIDSLMSSLFKDSCECPNCVKRRSLESEDSLEKPFENLLNGLMSSIGAELQKIVIADMGSNVIVWDITESEFTAPIEVVLEKLKEQYPGKEVLVKH